MEIQQQFLAAQQNFSGGQGFLAGRAAFGAESNRSKRYIYFLMIGGGLLLMVFAAIFIASFMSTKTGSCCLQTTCDVKKLGQPLPRGRENMCVVTQEEATLMGCPSYYDVYHNCTLSNNGMCSKNSAFITALVFAIAAFLVALILLITGIVGLKLLSGSRENLCPMFCGLGFSLVLCLVCAAVGAATVYRLSASPYSTSLAKECKQRSSSSRRGSSSCVSYRYATFANCQWTTGTANIFSWIEEEEKAESPAIGLVSVVGGFMVCGGIALLFVITKQTNYCECCRCCECCCAPLRHRHRRQQMNKDQMGENYLYHGDGVREFQ